MHKGHGFFYYRRLTNIDVWIDGWGPKYLTGFV